MGVLEKIKDIEIELKRTQVNKATEYHIGNLKARLAKLRTKLLEPPKGAATKGEGFDVPKFGSARICLIGFPSVGKSTLLTKITKTSSEIAEYEFTTLTCIPGVIEYKGCKLQLLDLPGIIEGAADGKGRGRQVIAVAKGSDMVLMVLDASKSEEQKVKLTKELEKVGIRLNKKKPDIKITLNKNGGVQLNSLVHLTYLNDRIVKNILGEYKIHNATVLVKDDSNIDDLIDAIEGNRKYINCLYVYNKIDTISMEDVDQIARKENSIVISCNLELNLDYLLDQCWEKLGLTRIYTKRKGCAPGFNEPLVLSEERNGVTIQSFCEQIHREFVKDFKFANVWGRSVKHAPQRVGLSHSLCDEDVVQIIKVVKKK